MANIKAEYRTRDIGDGICELFKDGVDCLCMAPAKEEPKRRDYSTAVCASVVVAGFLLGATFGGIMEHAYHSVPLFIASLAWLGVVAYANRRDR